MSNQVRGEGGERDDAHLADVEDGAGCTEIWEKLSERRDDAEDETETTT